MTMSYKLREKINNPHSWLSYQVSQAIYNREPDLIYLRILFLTYVVCLSTLFFTEKNPSDWNYDPAHLMYIYILMPITFAPFKFTKFSISNLTIHLEFSLYNIFRN